MQILKLEKALYRFFKATKINPVLWGIERHQKYREARNELERALLNQATEILRSQILKEIDEKIQVNENTIWTEAHEKQIRDIVGKHFRGLKEFISLPLLREFYLWLANKGGQSFIDKIRLREFKKVDIIGATFDLRDTALIAELMNGVDLLIEGLDDTTEEWLIQQFIKGKQEGLSSYDIANLIREKIPETYAYRADTIVATETANIVNRMEFETAKRNEATAKRWTTAGLNICESCIANEQAGWIGIDASFPSGHLRPPAHPNCKCLLEYEIPPYISGYGWRGE
jgi:hypothetical protein